MYDEFSVGEEKSALKKSQSLVLATIAIVVIRRTANTRHDFMSQLL